MSLFGYESKQCLITRKHGLPKEGNCRGTSASARSVLFRGSVLMMKTAAVYETLEIHFILSWLTAQDLIAFTHCLSLR
jgi:hypothetical protein